MSRPHCGYAIHLTVDTAGWHVGNEDLDEEDYDDFDDIGQSCQMATRAC